MKNDVPQDVRDDMDDLDDEVMAEIEAHVELHECERQDRLWLRSCTIFLESACKANKDGLNGAARIAVDEAVAAACDRATRIFHSDRTPFDENECL